MNGVGGDARAHELIAIGGPQIEPTGGLEPAIDVITLMARFEKRVAQFRTNLVTAGADARSNGRHEIAGARIEVRPQRLHGHNSRARRRAAPTGMNGRDRTRAPISQEQRHAVGGLHGENQRGIVADHDVRGWPTVQAARIVRTIRLAIGTAGGLLVRATYNDLRTVNLFQADDIQGAAGKGIGERRPGGLAFRPHRAQRERPARKQVRDKRFERGAPERRSPGF